MPPVAFAFGSRLPYSEGKPSQHSTSVTARDGKEHEPSKNEPNQNPGFAKNQTEPKPQI